MTHTQVWHIWLDNHQTNKTHTHAPTHPPTHILSHSLSPMLSLNPMPYTLRFRVNKYSSVLILHPHSGSESTSTVQCWLCIPTQVQSQQVQFSADSASPLRFRVNKYSSVLILHPHSGFQTQSLTLPVCPSQNSGISHSDWRPRHMWLESKTCHRVWWHVRHIPLPDCSTVTAGLQSPPPYHRLNPWQTTAPKQVHPPPPPPPSFTIIYSRS